ncbi:hypothetical protein BJF85_23720 [Saccharomonospora sp. CUA-673]|uniref:DUF3040 domain-containing protein n=1 Tax=Saccharomonospora sp. CUA-673 TaxID=1904969 RepID=UPI0009647D55|nr:DUF3040 domain-containing protein [Saccharomonospora sp. CUA-673]OLT41574.1 hypothetical protein BJF85_23720 [Saccharomonospora sp. CUA-673]
MGLRDDERRALADIERRLGEEDPQLAQRLATLRPGTSRLIWTALAFLGLFIGGGVLVAVGAGADAPVVMVLGVIVAAGIPTFLIWRRWLRKLGGPSEPEPDPDPGTGNGTGNGPGNGTGRESDGR